MPAETYVFSIDDQIDFSFDHDDYKVVFRSSRLGVPDVVSTPDFTCEDIFVDVSDPADGVLSEEHCRFQAFCPFFRHFLYFSRTNIVLL